MAIDGLWSLILGGGVSRWSRLLACQLTEKATLVRVPTIALLAKAFFVFVNRPHGMLGLIVSDDYKSAYPIGRQTPMGNEANIEDVVHTRIHDGQLPIAGQHRLFGGQGDGEVCACCDRSIQRSQLMFEVNCNLGTNVRISLHMHVPCFDVWTRESRAYWLEDVRSSTRSQIDNGTRGNLSGGECAA